MNKPAPQPAVYLDYAATTPVDPVVLAAMKPYFSSDFGNAGSLHSFGQKAIAAIDSARETVAGALGADFREIIFTGSATEANNLAVRGALQAWRATHPDKKARIITSNIEHESILETARDIEASGLTEVVLLKAGYSGSIDPDQLVGLMDDRTVLVSVMYANNETGAINPISAVSEIIKTYRTSNNSKYPLLHTDAVQAFQFLGCNVDDLGVDLLTLSGHKIYGPKGVGALYVRRPKGKLAAGRAIMNMVPIITGGGQEYGLRSGTENTPLIVGIGRAVELAQERRGEAVNHASRLDEQLWRGIQKIEKGAQLNVQGGTKKKSGLMLPNILNVYFPGHLAQDLLVRLDLAGVAISSGSACNARSGQPSHVLLGMGFPESRARRSVRFSFGLPTTAEEICRTLRALSSRMKRS